MIDRDDPLADEREAAREAREHLDAMGDEPERPSVEDIADNEPPKMTTFNADMVNKGRHVARGPWVRGPRGRPKLTEEDVLLIRSSPLSQKELAESFGVSIPTISEILSARTWRNLLPNGDK